MSLSIPERVQKMMDDLRADQVRLGSLAGASKSVVNQWISGGIKSIAPEYAFSLEKNTGYSAKWIMLGEGQEKLDPKIAAVARSMEKMTESRKDDVVKISTTLSEPNGNDGSPSTGTHG